MFAIIDVADKQRMNAKMMNYLKKIKIFDLAANLDTSYTFD